MLAFEHELTEKLLSETETMKEKVMRKFCDCGDRRRLPYIKSVGRVGRPICEARL